MKKSLTLLLTVALLFGLTACGGAAPKAPEGAETPQAATPGSDAVTLEFWHMLTGGDGGFLEEITNKFNEENQSGINVKLTVLKADELNQKLGAAATAKSGLPHAMLLEETSAALFKETVLQPIDGMLEQGGINKGDYNPVLWDVFSEDGKTYGLPVQTFTWVLYYNKDLLSQIGYSDADLEGLTLEKMTEMCEKTMALGSDYYGISLSGADEAVFRRLFYTSLWQNGSNLYDPNDPASIMFNNDAGIKGMTDAISLGKYTVPKGTAGRPPFVAGNVLFHFNGVWELSQLDNDEVKQQLNWGVVEFPKLFGGNKGVWAGAHGVGVTVACTGDAEKAAALEFCKYITDNALILSKAGHIPAKTALLETDEFKQSIFSFFAEKQDVFSIPPAGLTADAVYKTAVPSFVSLYWGEISGIKESMDEAAVAAKELAEE